MNVFLEYVIQNWALILILFAFAIMLRITVFLDRRTIVRMYVLIIGVFLLSICVYTEYHLAEINQYRDLRLWMIAIRYSATPLLLSYILLTLVKRAKWYILLPAFALAILNFISIWTGIVFSVNEAGSLVRTAFIGFLPYVGVGVYGFFLVFILIKQSNKQITEIIPVAFLAFTFATGLVFPFVMGKDYSKIFATTIAIGLFVYYVFLILQLTKKDPLTGLLNRQAYYASLQEKSKDITAFISIDMNGLKSINDNQGHIAGDKAIAAIALCIQKSTKAKQAAFRMGGDEFVILCRKMEEAQVKEIVEEIKRRVDETEYSCSIGYSHAPYGTKSFEEMAKESDQMMYEAKAAYYSATGKDRRIN